MPEISFYVLPTDSAEARYLFACKLIEKVYRNGVFPYVLTDSSEQTRIVDDLLWTFRAGSFIPHQVLSDDMPDLKNTVLIGANYFPELEQTTIVNLSSQIPQNLHNAERILEILDNSEATKTRGRQRYRHYQQMGMTVLTHKL